MKYIKKHIRKIGGVLMILPIVFISSCGDIGTNEITPEIITQVSQVDGEAIINISAKKFYEHDFFEAYRDEVVNEFGSQIMSALNSETQRAKIKGEFPDKTILLKDLSGMRKVVSPFSSHIRITEENGDAEDFVLGVRRYIEYSDEGVQKVADIRSLDEEETWIALSPDRFYLDDDEDGNEIWPITFDAVNLSDPSKKIEVTFNQDGLVTSTLSKDVKSKAALGSPNLLFVETIPVESCETSECLPDSPPPPTGGNGNGSNGNNVHSRGGPTGSYGANDIYFGIKTLRMAHAGDGDGALEMQMFVLQNDDYNYNMPVSYQYRFDSRASSDPIDSWNPSTYIQGADRGWPYYAYYEVPDVNRKGVDYDFSGNKVFISHQGNNYSIPLYTPSFPLFNLTQQQGPWRLVLVEDDKDYADHSRRRKSNHSESVQTFNMSSGSWSSVQTGFTVKSHQYGSSDDVMYRSGVRNITIDNASQRSTSGGIIVASKNYSGSTFKYVFRLGKL